MKECNCEDYPACGCQPQTQKQRETEREYEEYQNLITDRYTW